MTRVTKAALFVALFPSIWALSSVSAIGQWAEEKSVPEPTQLHAIVMAAGSELLWSKDVGDIESSDANARVSAIEVAGPDGDRIRGVSISLDNSTASDEIYIPQSLFSQLRSELQEIELTREFDSECQAKYRCVTGIARCRPSQTEKQAYCPGHFSTPTSEQGFVLSTPRNSFSFPTVDATSLENLIGKAENVLK